MRCRSEARAVIFSIDFIADFIRLTLYEDEVAIYVASFHSSQSHVDRPVRYRENKIDIKEGKIKALVFPSRQAILKVETPWSGGSICEYNRELCDLGHAGKDRLNVSAV